MVILLEHCVVVKLLGLFLALVFISVNEQKWFVSQGRREHIKESCHTDTVTAALLSLLFSLDSCWHSVSTEETEGFHPDLCTIEISVCGH